ncbi:bacteriocin [Streptococcus gallolyticus]|uniref:bacteriocin n=1 Tax=Streptococcus gallolyticus TaxID=315405 RepID=UPI00088CB0BE|nr:bacteriocin [Streptococcus gallolyticus]MCY7186420.1 bacteriocin [Streptococcus gallolyticus subsp. gallolyticus]SDK05654.1 hypothetical protein SAMN04487842_1402 [Streptococcus gallolyticus]SDL55855.1 hypothetical protein SAMN04487841_1407 [Streptococcus gallolyticus]
MVTKIVGVACLLIAVFQFYSTYKLFIGTKTNGNENTSHFLLASLWSGGLAGIILFVVGLGLLLNVF